jgi:hypothetical protein
MPGYLELVAKPLRPLHFELILYIMNPEPDPLTAIWTVQLPAGIVEPEGRRTLNGRTVAPPHRKVEANNWLIAIESPETYAHGQISASAELSVPKRHFSDTLSASVAQIRVA